jgi:hypothetical protein
MSLHKKSLVEAAKAHSLRKKLSALSIDAPEQQKRDGDGDGRQFYNKKVQKTNNTNPMEGVVYELLSDTAVVEAMIRQRAYALDCSVKPREKDEKTKHPSMYRSTRPKGPSPRQRRLGTDCSIQPVGWVGVYGSGWASRPKNI